MNLEPRQSAPPSLPAAFVETFDGLLAGSVGLDFARRHLVATLEQFPSSLAAIQALLERAYEETRLSDEDYHAFQRELAHLTTEDIPTDWSDDAGRGAHPAPAGTEPATSELARHLERAANPLYPGAVLRERYVLQARVATGGMAEVYKALDRRRQEAGLPDPFVAIKVVNPAFPRHERATESLQHEASVAQRLQHPGIGRVLDLDRDGEHHFLVLEWLDGESLAELLTRLRYRPVPAVRARRIVEEIGAALVHAHGRGIVHGDVKPGNIVLGTDGRARLVDFGAARELAAATAAVPGQATHPYASCEVLEGRPPTPRDDLYSLACVAYRMCAGQRPFARLSALEAEASGRRPGRISHVSATQWSALERALSLREDARHDDVAGFLRDYGAGAGVPVPVEPPEAIRTEAATPAVPSRAAPRRAAAAVALATALTLSLVIAWRDREPAAPGRPGTAAPTPAGSAAPSVPSTAAVTTAATPSAAPRREAAVETRSARRDDRPREATASAVRPAAAPATVPGIAAAAVGPPVPAPSAASPADAPAPADAAGTVADPPEVPLSALEFRHYVEPDFRGHEPGSVVVHFRVEPDGSTSGIAVVTSEPPGRFDATALAAVRRWRFRPPLEDGRPAARLSSVRLRFQPQ